MIKDAKCFIGAAVGGAIGYWLFLYLAGRGYYALALPGGILGIGAGVFRCSSRLTPLTCALLALALGVFTQWRYQPFAQDAGLGFFIAHFGDLPAATLGMIAVGTFAGFWVPFRRRR
jgi:hypothetical protein